jgi:hypothetical protein
MLVTAMMIVVVTVIVVHTGHQRLPRGSLKSGNMKSGSRWRRHRAHGRQARQPTKRDGRKKYPTHRKNPSVPTDFQMVAEWDRAASGQRFL